MRLGYLSGRRALSRSILGMGIVAALVVGAGTNAYAGTQPASGEAPPQKPRPPLSIETGSEGNAVTMSAIIGEEEQTVTIVMPGEASSEASNIGALPDELVRGSGDPMSSTQFGGSLVTAYESSSGVQTLIEIPSSNAPSVYSFPMSLPVGSTLERRADGSVLVLSELGLPLARVSVPWAIDANGAAIPTSLSVSDSTLVQTVEIKETTAFPVTADPDFWWLVGSSALCLAEIAGLVLWSAKVVQALAKTDKIIRGTAALLKYYNALGGKMSKVFEAFKSWIAKKASLTRAQIDALGGLAREAGKIIFNLAGLGTCFGLMTQR